MSKDTKQEIIDEVKSIIERSESGTDEEKHLAICLCNTLGALYAGQIDSFSQYTLSWARNYLAALDN